MQDWYQIPALVLTALLLPGFGQLYWRTRDIRNLLWFVAFLFVVARMLLLYPCGSADPLIQGHPWIASAAQCCAVVAAALFVGSLSPLSFRVGRLRILYVLPFTLPLVAYAVLAYGVFRLNVPPPPWFYVFPGLGVAAVAIGLLWAISRGSLPISLGVFVCALFGGMAINLYFRNGLYWPLILAESGLHLLMAMLVIWVFRRVSPGVFIAVLGFAIWSAPILLIFTAFQHPTPVLVTMRCVTMAKVASALGLLLLALENELAVNRSTSERERRARREMEAYSGLTLQRRRVDDFDHQAHEVCASVIEYSRFSQAALLLLQATGVYALAGAAGLDGAVIRALDALAVRIPALGFLENQNAAPAVDRSQTIELDLRPYLLPGDDLEHLRFTSAYCIPLRGRTGIEGMLLLAGMRGPEKLRHDDLVPLEMFVARLQALRSQTRMLERLVDAEKYAGLGQLAGNVFAQLNNPLTVILGYASLLEEAKLDIQSRRAVDAILNSARSLRSTLQSLQRVTRSPAGQLSSTSMNELLGDVERLQSAEFLQKGIEFRVNVPEELPRVLCEPQQLRQAVVHCLQFATDALDRVEAGQERVVRLEASATPDHVQIVIAHTGQRFDRPECAFDPFVPPRSGAAETAGVGLGLCATILRDCNGNISATNLEPTGAAILMELQTA